MGFNYHLQSDYRKQKTSLIFWSIEFFPIHRRSVDIGFDNPLTPTVKSHTHLGEGILSKNRRFFRQKYNLVKSKACKSNNFV